MSLHKLISNLLQAHSEYGSNVLLYSMLETSCLAVEAASSHDSYAKTTLNKVEELLVGYDVDVNEKLKSAHQILTECAIYLELQEKCLKVERMKEGPESEPDFLLKLEDVCFYAEVKVLGWKEGDKNYRKAMSDGIDAQIQIREQLKQGRTVGFGETEFTPFGNSPQSYETPTKVFVESVIEKISNNLKSSQFCLGNTFLLCDLSLFKHPTNATQSSATFYVEPKRKSICSGELWHIAFGRLGMPILQAIDFEGRPNICGYLEKQGILIDHHFVKGVVFRTSKLEGQVSYVGLLRHAELDEYQEIMQSICGTAWNTETNSYAFRTMYSDRASG